MASLARKFVVALAAAAAVTVGSSMFASAAKPAVQGCVGETFSAGAAAVDPGEVGATVSGLAQQDDGKPGLGDGMQMLQAGQVPDDVVPNACN